MSKIANWSRRQDLEDDYAVKVWENDRTTGDNPQFVAVQRRDDMIGMYEVGIQSSERGVQSPDVMPDKRVKNAKQTGNDFPSKLEKAEDMAMRWMEAHSGDVDLGSLDLMDSIGMYELGDVTEDKIEYVGDYNGEEADMVVIQLMKSRFQNRDPSYSIDGLIMRDGEGVVTDFRPTTNSQFSDAEDALDTLEDVVLSYDPEDAVMDEEMRL